MELLISNWMADLNGRNQNTYKFALQLAILDNCNENQITYAEIAKSFAAKYWNNVVAYNLRESINIDRAPYFHQSIIKIAKEHSLEGLYYKHATKKVKNLKHLIVDDIPGGYRTTLQNPISRLQAGSDSIRTGTGSPKGEGWLYKWDNKSELITLDDHFQNELFPHRELLKKLTVFHWALFIERYNQAPSVTNKLLDAKKSRTIKKLVREYIMSMANQKCFYCDETPENVEIDHFIPFAFLFDNPLWDLVYSCSDCNSGVGGKFEKLPPSFYLDKLYDRNKEMFNEDSEVFEGFKRLDDLQDYIKKTYQACLNAGFQNWQQSNVKNVSKFSS